MANLASRSYQYSLDLWIENMNSTSTYQEVYIYCNGKQSPNLAKSGSGWTYSNVWNPSLSCGQSYYVSWYIATASNSAEGGSYISTISCPLPPNTPTGFYAQNSEGSTTVRLYWNSVYNADSYTVRAYNQYGSSVDINSGLTGTTTTFSLTLGNSYFFRIWAINDAGESDYAETDTITLGYARPDEWNWYYTKSSGYDFNLTANEWRAFCNRINDFRRYKNPNMGDANFTYVYSGDDFRAVYFNQAIDAIDDMNPYTSTPSYKYKGDEVYASDINRLKNALNDVWR